MERIVGFTGRAPETERALIALSRDKHLLIKGRAGVGKSAFLRHLLTRLPGDRPAFWFASGSLKPAVDDLARQVNEAIGLAFPPAILGPRLAARAARDGFLPWPALARTVGRMTARAVAGLVSDALVRRRSLLFLESLEVAPSQVALFAELLEVAQIVAAMDDSNRRVRVDRLVWRFGETIDLKPLPLEHCEQITEGWLVAHPIRFSDQATRRRFIRHLAQESGGVPAALRGMLEAAEAEPEITHATARTFTHSAGVRYLDMTPLVILLLVATMALRYISRGASLEEMMLVSGIAMALFSGVRFFLGMLRARR